MNKLSISILILLLSNIKSSYDKVHTNPYEEFNWLDEDEYTIDIPFTLDTPTLPKTCCLYNGTNFCPGSCTQNNDAKVLSCKFTGATCGADPDNPATKYYYSLYCDDTNCVNNKDNLKVLTGDADITVAVKGSSFIHLTFFLLLCLFVF